MKAYGAVYTVSDSYSVAGPEGAYEYFAKLVDPTISNVVVDSSVAGVVDVRFVCDGGVIPGETLIQRVTDYLTDKSIRPLTDNVIVQAPDTQSYDISFTYYIPKSMKSAVSSIQADVETAVAVYNIWQTEKIGRDINPSYLIQKVMEAGAKRVDVTSPAFTVIDKHTIAKAGTVTITYGGVEDD